MSIEKRIQKLENRSPRQRTIEEMTNDELAELVTGIPGTKFDDLTDEYLQAVVRGEQSPLPYQTH